RPRPRGGPGPRGTGLRTASRGTAPGGGRPGTPRRFLPGRAVDTGRQRRGAHGWDRFVLACLESRGTGTRGRTPRGDFFSSLLAQRERRQAFADERRELEP